MLKQVTVIVYRREKSENKKKKDKVHKNTDIAYIFIAIKRTLPAFLSSIPHLPVCHLHLN